MSKLSSVKMSKWRYTNSLEVQQKTQIFMPVNSIKIKFKVVAHIESNAFGEVYRVNASIKKRESERIKKHSSAN
jgi:hypothetical protein